MVYKYRVLTVDQKRQFDTEGYLIIDSYRNKTKDRFRRSFICHYANSSSTRIATYYRPLFRADGTTVELDSNPNGGPCGVEYDTQYIH